MFAFVGEVSSLATTEMNGIPTNEDKFDDQQIPTASSSRSGMSNEDYDSDFDDSSPEDDEQVITKDTSHEDEEEQQNQVLVRRKL